MKKEKKGEKERERGEGGGGRRKRRRQNARREKLSCKAMQKFTRESARESDSTSRYSIRNCRVHIR
jgi:hypothetical protein